MSNLKEKHLQSICIAEILAKDSYFSASVNRSYYAVLQLVLHILFYKLGESQETFYSEALVDKTSTHVRAEKILGSYFAKKDLEDYNWYKRSLKELKKQRNKADYFNIVITQEEAYTSLDQSNSIINLLKKHFKS